VSSGPVWVRTIFATAALTSPAWMTLSSRLGLWPARQERTVRIHLTTILGIVGRFCRPYPGETIGWYRADEGTGLVGAVVGAVIILLIWGFIAGCRPPVP
jgi:uncharacterized membrane protein YeaQ/YmgE (transglycosylase-associated protein family)